MTAKHFQCFTPNANRETSLNARDQKVLTHKILLYAPLTANQHCVRVHPSHILTKYRASKIQYGDVSCE
jgi:hypothetical protein